MKRILPTLFVGIAAAVAVPSVAEAATLHQDGRTPHRLLFQDDVGQTNLVSVEGRNGVVIHDTNVPIQIDDVPTCMPIDDYTVSCSAVRRLELDLGIGFDHTSVNTPHHVSIEGGPGNDRYNSLATSAPSRVDFDGGIGLDTVSYFYATAGVDVSVDREAGDGRPGDDDQIRRNVEWVLGSEFDDLLSGSPYTPRLVGNDGNDRITGGSGEELLTGDSGNDLIDARDGAADSIDCGGQSFDRAAVDVGAEASISRCAEVGP